MFKFTVVIFAVIACAAAKPGFVAPLAYSAPLVAAAPGVVTATSNQVIARNYNGIASAPIYAAAPAPVVAAPAIAKYVAATPLAAPLAAQYVASPFASSLRYSAPLAPAPLTYAAAPLLL
ncbi:cuticle protein 16.5-like [Eupeodes corollae]|uniref:cuticle protein 16.5-like n=1 Tax=Eupeodes corollae TaxID=290404 RepID=UPI00249299C1|nr:cuticle protein 16.5-like [Eupeodes corollae]